MKIVSFGKSAKGIQLTGNPKSCEPDHVRLAFPGGDLEIVRATDGKNPDYWVHVRINHPQDRMDVPGETMYAIVCDARLDQHGKHAHEADLGDFANPGLYHIALRVKPDWQREQ